MKIHIKNSKPATRMDIGLQGSFLGVVLEVFLENSH
jgi:hypothetical protein